MTQQSSQEQELIRINYGTPRPYKWATGKYIGKLYKEAKENKQLVTNRCPQCKQLLWPPIAFCGRCKVDAGEDWVVMNQRGTVVQYTYLVVPMWDPHYGEKFANPYPTATIKLDDGAYLVSRLQEQDPEKLKVGMRVEAVWKEEGRGTGMGDVLYFRTIEE